VLAQRAAEPFECVIIPGGDHRLTDMAHRRDAVRASVAWLSRFLLG
jgi:dipeptidyl aminopeptidase/acylaminoacyl peptidase